MRTKTHIVRELEVPGTNRMHERTVLPTGEEVEVEVATGIEARILGDVTWAEDRIDLIPTQGNHLNVTSVVHDTIGPVNVQETTSLTRLLLQAQRIQMRLMKRTQ